MQGFYSESYCAIINNKGKGVLFVMNPCVYGSTFLEFGFISTSILEEMI